MSVSVVTGRTVAAMLLAGVAAATVGCGPFRLPEIRGPISVPTATIESVERIEEGEEASTYAIHLSIDSDHDEPLPMVIASYILEVDGLWYRTETAPNATVPAERGVTVTLPAVIENGAGPGAAYRARGWVQLHPPGQVKEFLYGIGWPRPRAMFSREGQVE